MASVVYYADGALSGIWASPKLWAREPFSSGHRAELEASESLVVMDAINWISLAEVKR